MLQSLLGYVNPDPGEVRLKLILNWYKNNYAWESVHLIADEVGKIKSNTQEVG